MPISAIPFDLEGVLYQRGAPLSGALDAVAELHSRGLARPFLKLALADMEAEPGSMITIGDDVASYIAGTQNAVFCAVQVRTGKFRTADQARADIVPEERIDSIRDLPALLDRLG